MLAGIDALTITPSVLKDLAATQRPQEEVENMSLFGKTGKVTNPVGYPTYIDSESQYRVHFAASEDGRAQFKTAQVRIHFKFAFLAQARLTSSKYRQLLCSAMPKLRWSCMSSLNWRTLLTFRSTYDVKLWLGKLVCECAGALKKHTHMQEYSK
jgi:hypothetical protein